MSKSGQSKVFMFDSDDPEMQGAAEKARATFRYFWRELAWERRRIIPALELASVKAPFSDSPPAQGKVEAPQLEQMWLNEIDFDGEFVAGFLLNEPNWLKTIKAGDPVRMALGDITDWMYVIDRQVYGAFTVNLLRSRMEPRERAEHDKAWGLEFGDSGEVRLMPPQWGESAEDFDTRPNRIGEHPMSESMGPELKKQLAAEPALLSCKDEQGWTLLHHLALAGSAACVSALLEAGADANAVTNDGRTPLQLAKSLGWENVVSLLSLPLPRTRGRGQA